MSSKLPPPANSAAAVRYYLKLDDHAVEIAADGLLIGRCPSCDVVISDSQVSRRHAQLSIAKGRPAIEDLGSANGVYLNGERLTGRRELQVGDILLIGGSRFELATGAQLASKLDGDAGREVDTVDDLPVLVVARGAEGAEAPGEGQADAPPRLYVDDPEGDAEELPGSGQTRQADVLVLFGQVAQKMLAAGQTHAAEQLLRPRLMELLTETRARPRDAGELVEIAASTPCASPLPRAKPNGSTMCLSFTASLRGRRRFGSWTSYTR